MILHKKLSAILCLIIFAHATITGMDVTPPVHIPPSLTSLPTGVITYLKNLPHIKMAHAIHEKAQEIARFLCAFSNTRNGKVELQDIDKLETKIYKYIETNNPILCILVAFAAKSTNTETKVLQSQSIDMAECAALLTLYHICQEISSIHTPGATIGIWSREAHVYDLNKVSQEHLGISLYDENTIEQYQKDLETAIKPFEPTLKLINIENTRAIYEEQYAQLNVQPPCDITGYEAFMKEELHQNHIRDIIESQIYNNKYPKLVENKKLSFLPKYSSWDLLKQAFATGNITKKQFDHVKSYIPVKETLNTIAHKLANTVVMGALRNRALMRDNIPGYDAYIRFSVSPAETGSVAEKLGISLCPGSYGTPWHNTLVVQKNGVKLKHRSELTNKDGSIQGIRKQYTIGNLTLVYMIETEES